MTYEACVPNKTEALNLSLFNMITGINELKTLTKDKPCECNCKFDGRKCNSNQMWNTDKRRGECKRKKIIFGTLPHVVAKMVNILQILLMIQ